MSTDREVVIRRARPDELDAVADVTMACYAEYEPDASASPDEREMFAEYRKDLADVRGRVALGAVIILAVHEERIAGTVTYFPPGSDKSSTGWPDEIAAVRLLGVLPSERGYGIGRTLTEECIRRARAEGAPAIGLHTTELMKVAGAMYERMGFVRVPENDFADPDLLIAAYRLEL